MFSFTSASQLGGLYHVGTLDISRKSSQSHEWNGLSVSNCPDAWRQICGCSGTCWELVPNGQDKLLLMHEIGTGERASIRDWSIGAGYFKPDVEYRVYYIDEEYDEERYFVYSGDEHQAAVDEYEFRLEECPGVRFEEICDGLVATNKLLSASMVSIDPGLYRDIAAMLYAEQVLGCDGAWWEDVFDPFGLSAPRGVIFNSRIGSYSPHDVGDGPGR